MPKAAFLGEALDHLLDREGARALREYNGVYFLYAGARLPREQRGSLFWSHQNQVTHRGRRWDYAITREGGWRMTSVSTLCHEMGHLLGLPDLYLAARSMPSMDHWCAMARHRQGRHPQHLSAWCKARLGWLHPTTLDPAATEKIILRPGECVRVLPHHGADSYFLLENRQPVGFDASLPGPALLLWQIEKNRPVLDQSRAFSLDGTSSHGFLSKIRRHPGGRVTFQVR